MMGRREQGQGQFFYDFHLDAVVPADHLVRKIDAVLDTSWVHGELAPFYSHTGRPSVDPELMIRMLIVGYVFAIRSERQLCEEVPVNLAYRWFCGLGIEDQIPNHSVFSRARNERFREADAIRLMFERVVGACISAGLVGGASFSIDASLIKADVDKVKRVPGDEPVDWPGRDEASRAVREYLDVLDTAAHSDDESGGGNGGGSGHGRSKPAKQVSLTDPQAAWVGRKGVDPFFAYDANYLIDNKAGVIVDAQGTRANRSEEIAVTETMVERVERRFELKPDRLAGDTVYGAVRMLKWLMERGIEPHIPVWDKSRRADGTFSRADFAYEPQADLYICPGGNALRTTGTVHDGKTKLYRARKADCDGCALKRQCCPKASSRKVPRDIHEAIRDQVRALADTPAFEQSRRERKKVEMAFAHMKRILKLDRLRLRGLSGARDEVLLTATAQNLRKMARAIWRPPKDGVPMPA
ncbi:MAG: transposase [bacterium]|nr:transposase [bacterium]